MTSQSPSESALDAELEEKDRLIAALTAQLERTVNQLDRLRRSGADRPGSLQADEPGNPEQQALISRLGDALDEWSEFHPADRILRIEDGVEQILKLLADRERAPPRVEPPTRAEAPPERKQKAADPDFWEAAKARLLSESPPPSEPSAVPPSAATVAFDATAEQESFVACPVPLIDPPEPVDNNADKDALRSAVETRDAYIHYLLNRLQALESQSTPVPWQDLAAAPQELARRLQELEATLREQLKQAEIANSLERAALTRERAKLAQVKQNLESQIRKLAHARPAPPPPAAEEEPASEEQERRWNRLFKR